MDPKRVLIVYFSRTGTTRTVARALQRDLGCDIDRIRDPVHRGGVFGYLRSAVEAFLQRPVPLRPMRTDPQDYDLVIVGTPIWNASVASPVRSYLSAHRDSFRRVAFFCTYGGSGSARVLRQMESVAGKPPAATLAMRASEVSSGAVPAKVASFVEALGRAVPDEVPVAAAHLRPQPA
jgi:flavodoxin